MRRLPTTPDFLPDHRLAMIPPPATAAAALAAILAEAMPAEAAEILAGGGGGVLGEGGKPGGGPEGISEERRYTFSGLVGSAAPRISPPSALTNCSSRMVLSLLNGQVVCSKSCRQSGSTSPSRLPGRPVEKLP